MEDRPKRVVNKPVRYKTTSSDEGPPQKRTAHPTGTIPEGGIEEDIEDIRAILDKDKETDINFINNSTHTQYTPPHTHAQYMPPLHTHTNITTYTAPAGATHEPHIQTSRSYIPESETSYYANNKYFELQNTARSWTRTQRENVQLQSEQGQLSYGQHSAAMMLDQIIKKMDSQYQEVNDRLDRMETQMKKTNTFLENIYKCVQNTNQRASVPCRPEMFPIASIAQLRAFQDINEELYSNAVNYFHYIGGFNFKEAVNLCFKDSIQDSLTPLLTWFRGKENQEGLYNTRLVKAIYDGICRNRHFERPLRSEFQTQMQAALRTAKERYRHRRRPTRTTVGGPRIQRDLWGDAREEEQELESENT